MQMEIVLQGERRRFNSISDRWDLKKRNIQEAFLAAEFQGGGKYKPWNSGMSWEQLLLGQLGLIGCQQTSHSLAWSCGAIPGYSFPLGFVFLAANELRGSEVSPGSLSGRETGWICFAFGLWFALQALGRGVIKTKI